MPATEYVLKRSNINSSVDSFGRVVLKGVKYFSLEKLHFLLQNLIKVLVIDYYI